MVRLLSTLREAMGSLLSHPLRSVLTGASVTFGAAVLIILLSYAGGFPDTTGDMLRGLGSKEFIIEPRRRRGPAAGRSGRRVQIRYSDMPAIREACPSVEALAPTYRPGRGGPVFSEDRSWPWANLTGVGYAYREVTDLKIVQGRWFSREEEQLAEEVGLISLPLSEGMFDGRSAIGKTLDAFGRRFRIIGVFESNASFAYSLFVPYPTSMDMGDTGGRFVSQLAFSPRRPDLAKDAIREMRAALTVLYSLDPEDDSALDVKENTAFAEKIEAVSLGLETLVIVIATIALVLGCLGAANVVGIAVTERTGELGLRKALGATSGRLRAEVVSETLILCMAGGALGVGLGAACIRLLGPLSFSENAVLVPRIDTTQLATASLLLVVTATLASLPAANRAARLNPVEALRSE